MITKEYQELLKKKLINKRIISLNFENTEYIGIMLSDNSTIYIKNTELYVYL